MFTSSAGSVVKRTANDAVVPSSLVEMPLVGVTVTPGAGGGVLGVDDANQDSIMYVAMSYAHVPGVVPTQSLGLPVAVGIVA